MSDPTKLVRWSYNSSEITERTRACILQQEKIFFCECMLVLLSDEWPENTSTQYKMNGFIDHVYTICLSANDCKSVTIWQNELHSEHTHHTYDAYSVSTFAKGIFCYFRCFADGCSLEYTCWRHRKCIVQVSNRTRQFPQSNDSLSHA